MKAVVVEKYGGPEVAMVLTVLHPPLQDLIKFLLKLLPVA